MAEVVVAMEKVDEVEKVRTCWYRRELRVARMLLGVVMLLGASLEHSAYATAAAWRWRGRYQRRWWRRRWR